MTMLVAVGANKFPEVAVDQLDPVDQLPVDESFQTYIGPIRTG